MRKRNLPRLVIVLLLASTLLVVLQYGDGTAEAADGAWTDKTDIPTPRAGFAVGVVDGQIYAIGGYYSGWRSTVEMYDPVTDTWITKADMPTSRDDLAVGVVDGQIYAIGGYDGSNSLSTVEMYDPNTNTWTTRASMPTPREFLTAGVVDGQIYAIGGFGSSGWLSTVEMYDPNTNTWTTRASMPTARESLAVGVVDGQIYAIGGQGVGAILSTVEMYDPNTNTWTTRASMPTARVCLAAGVVDGQIYAISGFGSSGWLSTLEMYSPYASSTSAPRDLQAVPGDGGVVLGWSAPISDGGATITGYKIYRGTTSGDLTLLTTVGNVLTYTDTSLSNGQTHYYQVSALNIVGESSLSNVVSATLPVEGGSQDQTESPYDAESTGDTVSPDDTDSESRITGKLIATPILLLSLLVFVFIVALSIVFKRRNITALGVFHSQDSSAPALPPEPHDDYSSTQTPAPPPAPSYVTISTPITSSTDLLENAITLCFPSFIDTGSWAEIIMELKNNSEDTIKDISLNLSILKNNFDVEGGVEVAELLPGMQLKKRIRIRPKHEEGVFPVKIRVVGNGTSFERQYTIKVGGTEVY